MFKLLFSLALLNLPCIFEIQHHSLEPHRESCLVFSWLVLCLVELANGCCNLVTILSTWPWLSSVR